MRKFDLEVLLQVDIKNLKKIETELLELISSMGSNATRNELYSIAKENLTNVKFAINEKINNDTNGLYRSNLLKGYLIKRYLRGKSIIGLKAKKVSKKIGIPVSKTFLGDISDSMIFSIEEEIKFQIQTEDNIDSSNTLVETLLSQNENLVMKKKSYKEYSNMSLEEIRKYVKVYDDYNSTTIVDPKHFIEDPKLRAQVALIALGKGGTYIGNTEEFLKFVDETYMSN